MLDIIWLNIVELSKIDAFSSILDKVEFRINTWGFITEGSLKQRCKNGNNGVQDKEKELMMRIIQERDSHAIKTGRSRKINYKGRG
jgi:hypothetical protein